jgi:hypothetical protein
MHKKVNTIELQREIRGSRRMRGSACRPGPLPAGDCVPDRQRLLPAGKFHRELLVLRFCFFFRWFA